MDKPILIAPSILAADFSRLGQQVAQAEASGADYVHVDVMDGNFVPNITLGPVVVEAVRRITRLPLDVHLMVHAPERYVSDFRQAGADHLIVHVETCPHLHRTVQHIKELGCRAGVTLNPSTPAVTLEETLPYVDQVLVMTVNPGFGGQQFIDSMLSKIRRIRAMLDRLGSKAELEVDGGIDPHTAPLVVAAGATVLVAGSAIFGANEGIAAAIAQLRAAAYGKDTTKSQPRQNRAGSWQEQ
jgi:ribulose-phosphate 3-epimerase